MSGLFIPSQQKAILDAAAKAKASSGGYSGIPAASTPSFSQSLNLYGTPATNTRSGSDTIATPVKKATVIPAAKTDAQMAADAQVILDKLAGISTRVDALGGSTGGGGGGGGGGTVVTPDPVIQPIIKKPLTPNVAYDTIGKILESYGITGLASVLATIRDEYPEARSDELISLLQFDSRYNAKFNERFAGNVARQKAGLSVLSPGDYLKTEESYKKVLTAYGLTKFNNQTYYDKFITSDIASTELTDRIQLAYDRVMGDEPVLSAFKKFYSSVGLGDIVTAMLDPVNQLPDLERKVKAAEIGGAALRQGFTNISQTATGMTVGADVLAQQGLTKGQAEAGYKIIAQELPQAEKFSSIYAGQSERYGMLEAEKDTLQGLASEERKKRALIALEAAQFGGDTGTSKASVNTNYLNRTSGAGQF
jgi:hypothetical protein